MDAPETDANAAWVCYIKNKNHLLIDIYVILLASFLRFHTFSSSDCKNFQNSAILIGAWMEERAILLTKPVHVEKDAPESTVKIVETARNKKIPDPLWLV